MTKHILIIIRLITRFPVEKLERALTLYILIAERQLDEQRIMNAHMAEIVAGLRAKAKSDRLDARKIYKWEAIDKLGISERTYDRRKEKGILKPRGDGHDFYFAEDLEEALKVSKRKGKI